MPLFSDHPAPLHRAAPRACALACACIVMAGCNTDDTGLQGGKFNSSTDSIFSAFAPPTPVQAVQWATDPYDAGKRQYGILLLAGAPWGGEGPYVRMYTLAAKDEDSSVRTAAIRALSLHGSVEHAPLLIEALSTGDALTRREAARALQRIHSEDAVEPLLTRLSPADEPEYEIRRECAVALGQYPTRKVVQSLISALSDRRLGVNEAARASLKTITGEDFGYEIDDWVGWSTSASDLFAKGTDYEYPVFSRDQTWYEALMFWYSPPNEIPGRPVGSEPLQYSESGEGSLADRPNDDSSD